MGSRGVAFRADQPLAAGTSVELSISWPALLDEVCPMRLSVSGRLLRVEGGIAVCTVEKYEFRTQGAAQPSTLVERAAALQSWLVGARPGASAARA
jgi:hypothetical protein